MIRRVAGAVVFTLVAAGCRRPPKTDPAVSIPLPDRSEPASICAAGDGALWVTLAGAGRVLRIEPVPPYRTTAIPLESNSRPGGIATGPDGALWFVEQVANRIGRVQADWPYTLVEYALPSRWAPVRIAAGPDRAMWFVASAVPRLGRIAVDSPHAITEVRTSGPENGQWSGGYGWAIAPGSGDTVWFTATFGVCWIHAGRIVEGVRCRVASPNPFSSAGDLVRASDGAPWHIVSGEGIERQDLATGGEIFPLALGRAYGARLASDSTGRIWATSGDGLWEIPVADPSHAIVHPLGSKYRPGGIAVAPDGRVWFIDAAANILRMFAPG